MLNNKEKYSAAERRTWLFKNMHELKLIGDTQKVLVVEDATNKKEWLNVGDVASLWYKANNRNSTSRNFTFLNSFASTFIHIVRKNPRLHLSRQSIGKLQIIALQGK